MVQPVGEGLGFRPDTQLSFPNDYFRSAQVMTPEQRSQFLNSQLDAFLDRVQQTMTPNEVSNLPTEPGQHLNAVMRRALDQPDTYHNDLANLIVARYQMSRRAERFFQDPTRENSALFTDDNGELVSLEDAEIKAIARDMQGAGERYIRTYSKSYIWTGPDAEKTYKREEHPIHRPALPDPEEIKERPQRKRITPKEKINQVLTKIQATMTPAERAVLPAETSAFFNANMRKALENVDAFKAELSELVGFLYHYSPQAERFIYDPVHDGALFVDGQGNLVTLVKANIETLHPDAKGLAPKYIYDYQDCLVLTGSDKGKTFTPQERPIPSPPKPKQFQAV